MHHNTDIHQKLQALRQLMEKHQVDYYYVPSTDAHKNEYVPAVWQRRAWISHFTGSAGDVLVGRDKAYLWTDPRYFLQATQELDPALYQLMKIGQGETSPIDVWLNSHHQPLIGATDPKVISMVQAARIQSALQDNGGQLRSIEENWVDSLWQDQPKIPCTPIRIEDIAYTGCSTRDKLAMVRKALREKNATAHAITVLDAIAWLLNIRGNDVIYNPLVISYVIVTQDKATLFVNLDKITDEDRLYFQQQHVDVSPYDAFPTALQALRGMVWVDPDTASWWVEQQLQNAVLLKTASPITLMKAIKNPVEQAGAREAHRLDALAVIQFLQWLEEHWQEGVTELSAAHQLAMFRRNNPKCLDLSFPSISGFAAHGAIVHYAVTQETDIPIDNSSLYLIDSGGQYHEGTTDITRTIHLGQPTDQQKRHYTLVLKGHLAIRHLIFPDGTCGEHINALAHMPLWQEALDYGHGTGHGVGAHLCVHEGPHAITSRNTGIPLKPGMIVSNEPGVYLENHYGIRIENLCLVKEHCQPSDSLTGHGPFYTFEDLTWVPYCHKLIDKSLLAPQEVRWIDDYHQHTGQILMNDLPAAARQWLKKAVAPL